MNVEWDDLLSPLAGMTTTFLVEGRPANAALARALMSACAKSGAGCRVLDLDAFYSSNAGLVFGGLPGKALESVLLDVPEPGEGIAAHVSALFEEGPGLLVIDSMNTLHHMLSLNGRSLSFVVAALSTFSRANGVATVIAMYRRERPVGEGRTGSIAELTDNEVHARVAGGLLILECARGEAWAGGPLVVPTT